MPKRLAGVAAIGSDDRRNCFFLRFDARKVQRTEDRFGSSPGSGPAGCQSPHECRALAGRAGRSRADEVQERGGRNRTSLPARPCRISSGFIPFGGAKVRDDTDPPPRFNPGSAGIGQSLQCARTRRESEIPLQGLAGRPPAVLSQGCGRELSQQDRCAEEVVGRILDVRAAREQSGQADGRPGDPYRRRPVPP